MQASEIAKALAQSDERKRGLENGSGAWTIVYESWNEEDRSGARFAAFATPEYRKCAVESAGWDMSIGGGFPGFVKSYEDGDLVTTYHRNVDGPDVEPIVIVQDMHGVVEDRCYLSEEFRLLLNLWEDKNDGNYYTFSDDGSKHLAVEFKGERICVRTPLLRRYQAARQLDLLLFSESTISVPTELSATVFAALMEADHPDGDAVVSLSIGDGFGSGSIFSRLLMKRILVPPVREKCGLWPWRNDNVDYLEFIINEDEDGQLVKFTCDPDKLANYFGANADAPHYLTPVFFMSDVLKRYFDDPALYTIGDGRLSCARLWSLQLDNATPGVVSVFLGDLGRDLPESHRDHWRSYNIAPVAQMSETAVRRSFFGQFAESTNPEHHFKDAYAQVQLAWKRAFGWSLYRDATGRDADIIRRLHIPLAETDSEFEAQLLNLAMLLVDMLNESELMKGHPAVPNEKGISKLERFLWAHNYDYTDRDIGLLRDIQRLRSVVAAHSTGSRGKDTLADALAGRSKRDYFTQTMRDSARMLTDLSNLHPSAPVDSG